MVGSVNPKWPKTFTLSEVRALKDQLIRDGYRMTRDNFAKASSKLVSGMSAKKTEKIARLFHYDYLVNALQNGKVIPTLVLKDYPKSKYPKLYAIGR